MREKAGGDMGERGEKMRVGGVGALVRTKLLSSALTFSSLPLIFLVDDTRSFLPPSDSDAQHKSTCAI